MNLRITSLSPPPPNSSAIPNLYITGEKRHCHRHLQVGRSCKVPGVLDKEEGTSHFCLRVTGPLQIGIIQNTLWKHVNSFIFRMIGLIERVKCQNHLQKALGFLSFQQFIGYCALDKCRERVPLIFHFSLLWIFC